MAARVVRAGAVLYRHGTEPVKTLDVVVKGTLRAGREDSTFDLPAGSIVGIGEMPGKPYILTYEAADEVTLFSYPYESEASLVAMFKANPRILGMLIAGCVRFAKNLQAATLDTMELARAAYAETKQAQQEYPKLAISVGEAVREFRGLSLVQPPTMLDPARGWHRDFVEDLASHEETLKRDVFSIPSIGLGIGLTVNSYALESREFILTIFEYLDGLRRTTGEFLSVFRALETRAASAGSEVADSSVTVDPSVHHPLDAILLFANPDAGILDRFRRSLAAFSTAKDRYGSDDAARRLRRELTEDFYRIYEACVIAAADTPWSVIPPGVRMFLLFGYADEQLAGGENAVKLAAIADTLAPGKGGRVITAFEWLLLVRQGRVMPSKNEFDLDYPGYLKSLVRNGDISETEEQYLLRSPRDRMQFELKNFITLGNRLTYGRITRFTPVFDRDNVTRRLEQSYLDAARIRDALEEIRSIDFSAFCRQGVYSDTEAGINAFYTDVEVLPYVILMPNVGSRAALWQEIETKKRSTPARMALPIFFTENLEDALLKLVGEFRWEMCKTEQGVHWNDVTDPSLTSMYCDYLQFYRKNTSLSQDAKERLSVMLKNNSNSFKKVFTDDYFTYMKYESQGALRLNRTARSILFTFCPFSQSVRNRIADNPQFAACIRQHEANIAQQKRVIENLAVKLQKKHLPLPEEILRQQRFLDQ